MLTLALDTAAEACAAAIHDSDGDRIAGAVSETIGRGHAERLMAVIDAALAEAGVALSAIGRIAVTVGPGSFTGIRVGVSTARALALALGCDAAGISTLEAIGALAAIGNGSPVLAVIDARRGEVYAQLFDTSGEPASAPAALEPAAAAELAAKAQAALAGSGAEIVAAASSLSLPILTRESVVDIAAVARRAAKLSGPFERPSPLYLRGADAKPQTGFAIARKAAATR